MSTTIVVKARAWGAAVSVAQGDTTDSFTLGAHEDRNITIQPGQSVTITVDSPAEAPRPIEEVLGADENIGSVAADPPADDLSKFDHDGDGKPGGSKKKASSTDEA